MGRCREDTVDLERTYRAPDWTYFQLYWTYAIRVVITFSLWGFMLIDNTCMRTTVRIKNIKNHVNDCSGLCNRHFNIDHGEIPVSWVLAWVNWRYTRGLVDPKRWLIKVLSLTRSKLMSQILKYGWNSVVRAWDNACKCPAGRLNQAARKHHHQSWKMPLSRFGMNYDPWFMKRLKYSLQWRVSKSLKRVGDIFKLNT